MSDCEGKTSAEKSSEATQNAAFSGACLCGLSPTAIQQELPPPSPPTLVFQQAYSS